LIIARTFERVIRFDPYILYCDPYIVQLASERTGNTDFVHCSLGDILLGNVHLPERDERRIIFSPFGLRVLDLAGADLVQKEIAKDGGGTRVESFLP
jgi:ornithine cyclodeaminase/alanine dehydrogenase-like protein (mu-crystallin family)